MKIEFVYPKFEQLNQVLYGRRIMSIYDITLDTRINYCKNYDLKYKKLIIKMLGFGLRITLIENKI